MAGKVDLKDRKYIVKAQIMHNHTLMVTIPKKLAKEIGWYARGQLLTIEKYKDGILLRKQEEEK